MSSLKIFGTIEKAEQQEDGTIMVSGYASSEAVDSQGEIVTATAMKAALPDYMKFANVREMHQPKAAGTTVEAAVQDDGRTWIKAHIVDSEAVKKVQAKVYKGFSIGGRVTDRDEANKATITGFKLSEISLVDRPANPDSVFECWKADGVQPEAESETEEAIAEPEEKKEEPATDKAEDVDTQKGMYDVACLAQLLESLNMLRQSAAWEAAIEGDGSSLPERLKGTVIELGTVLQEMVSEETTELTEEKGEEAEDLQKAGARHSKADMDKLQAIHDHSTAMGASCGGDEKMQKVDYADALQKITDMQSTIEKMEKDNQELVKRIKQLEEEPGPIKGVLKAVEKGEDASLETTKEEEPTDTTSMIRKIHKSGGRALF